jgi:sulfide:quinone oxidoreductase
VTYGRPMTAKPPSPRILVAGGGVAALEAVLALRALAGRLPAITLLASEPEFAPPATSVASPFGFGVPTTLPLEPFADTYGVQLRRGVLARVDTTRRVATLADGGALEYDHLLIAVGARRRAAVPSALTFRGPGDVDRVEEVLDDMTTGRAERLVVTLPSLETWPVPAYELAIMAAVELRSRGLADPDVALVTPETQPLKIFGPAAAEAVAKLLRERGVALHIGRTPIALVGKFLRTADGRTIPADRVIALPGLTGPSIPGLPHDARGFIPTRADARVVRCDDVYAAGDATTFPLRQGGLAAQQADAAAETIAARLGAIAHAEPFRPVLRGVLLTGGAPLYLRAVLGTEETPVARRVRASTSSTAGQRALWWPPAKVAGRYLAPLLATARPTALLSAPMSDLGPGHSEGRGDDDPLGLALALADEEASCGDYREAVHALDAARALTGGVLPESYAAKQRDWSSLARSSHA